MIKITITKFSGEDCEQDSYRRFADDTDVEVLKDALQDMYYSLLDKKIAF